MKGERVPGDTEREINDWIAQTRYLAARFRVILPPLASSMAELADAVEGRMAALLPEPPPEV